MRHGLALVALLFAWHAHAAEPLQEVTAALERLNNAFTTHDASTITSLMLPNHLAITPWAGRQTREEQVSTLGELRLEHYTPGPTTLTPIGDDGVLVTYTLGMKGDFKGKPLASQSFVAAVWVKADGAWKELHYQETALAP